jgi:ankyrin repeat protein
MTPTERLILACNKGDLGGVKTALAGGANINCKNALDEPAEALTQAALNSKIEVLKYLLEKRANAKGVSGARPLMWCIRNGDLEGMKILLNAGATFKYQIDNAVDLAAESGDIRAIDLLISSGADINNSDARPLTHAAINGNIEMVKHLIKNGLDIENAKHAAFEELFNTEPQIANIKEVSHFILKYFNNKELREFKENLDMGLKNVKNAKRAINEKIAEQEIIHTLNQEEAINL